MLRLTLTLTLLLAATLAGCNDAPAADDGTDLDAESSPRDGADTNATDGPAMDGLDQAFDGSWLVGGPAACLSEGYAPGSDGIDHAAFAIDPLTWGHPWSATFSYGPETAGYVVEFWDGEPGPGATRLGVQAAIPPLGDGATVSGTVPDQATVGVLATCLGGPASAHYMGGPTVQVE